jgi:hypothetical protein
MIARLMLQQKCHVPQHDLDLLIITHHKVLLGIIAHGNLIRTDKHAVLG